MAIADVIQDVMQRVIDSFANTLTGSSLAEDSIFKMIIDLIMEAVLNIIKNDPGVAALG